MFESPSTHICFQFCRIQKHELKARQTSHQACIEILVRCEKAALRPCYWQCCAHSSSRSSLCYGSADAVEAAAPIAFASQWIAYEAVCWFSNFQSMACLKPAGLSAPRDPLPGSQPDNLILTTVDYNMLLCRMPQIFRLCHS